MVNRPKIIIIHTEGAPVITDQDRFDIVNRYHQGPPNYFPRSSLGYFMGYHYWIPRNGALKQARLDTDEGAHTKGMNLMSLGIALEGNGDLALPTAAQIQTLKKFFIEKLKQYNLTKSDIHYHREYNTAKTCPGRLISDSWARDLLTDEPSIAEKLSWLQREIARIQAIILALLAKKPLGFRDLDAPCEHLVEAQ